jgi:GPH family glycoside/pentoside/hexuronide:cation symporter
MAHDQTSKVGLAAKLFYGSGQAVDAVVQAALGTFLLFYLTAVVGLSGAEAGVVLFLSLAIDGLLDPAIGRLSDNWRSRWGRRLPFMMAALLPMAGAMWALFSIPPALNGGALLAYVLLLNVAVRVGLSVFALPHSALNAELTDDYRERSVLSGFRAIFIVAGTLACVAPAFAIMFAAEGSLETRGAYPEFGMWVGLLIVGFGFTCVFGAARPVLRLTGASSLAPAQKVSFLTDIGMLFRNPSFTPLFAGAVLVLVAQGMSLALNLHLYRYFWHLKAEYMQLPVLMLPVGMLAGTILSGPLLRFVEKRDGVLLAICALALYVAVLPLIVLFGIVEPGGPLTLWLLAGHGFMFGTGGAICFVCFYSMIADAVDEHDHLFGIRREALYAAALMIGAKAATGLGGLVAGLALQAVGFNADLAAAGELTNAATVALGLLWGPGTALLIVASVPIFLRYRITRARHAELVEGLKRRASGEAIAGAA